MANRMVQRLPRFAALWAPNGASGGVCITRGLIGAATLFQIVPAGIADGAEMAARR